MRNIPFPLPNSLDSAETSIAASAYEAACDCADETAERGSARHIIARYILDRMFRGERDPIQLRDGALAKLGLASNRTTARLSSNDRWQT